MPIRRLVALRGRAASAAAIALALGAAGCSAERVPTATPSPTPAAPTERATPVPTPPPTPTPEPTPRFTNSPDPELAAIFPATVAGVPLVVAPVEEFALTPGDVGLAYGEIGVRFVSLAIAYVEQPRLTLYAVRVVGDPVSTKDLEPYLATAGRYLGIAGLVREPWELTAAGGHQVWMRAGDAATAANTLLSTWSSGEFVFLLIGVDDAVNRALIGALPGEPAPSPTPVPSATERGPSPSATGG